MKKSLCFLLGLFILFSLTCFAQDQKFTAAVMDLTTEQGVSASVSRMLSDYLRTQLFNTQKYTLVTRENMEQILKEQQFQLSGCTSQECIVQVGQLLGVRKMFTGSIGKIGATYMLTLKIIDVESGRIEKAETEECPKCEEDALIVSTRNITNRITGIKPSEEKPISKGKLSVISSPDNANVYLDGEKIGITPILEYELTAGKYGILLKKTDYETQISPIEILPGKTTIIKPLLKIQTGSANIISNPEGAQVFLNGEYKGLTPLILSDIPVGDYSIALLLNNYETVKQKLTIFYNKEIKLEFTLHQKELISPDLGGRFGIGINWLGAQSRYGISNSLLVEGVYAFASNNNIVGGRLYFIFAKIPGTTTILLYTGAGFDWILSQYLTSGYETGGFLGTELLVTKNIGIGGDVGLYYVDLKSTLGTYADYGIIFNVGVTYYF